MLSDDGDECRVKIGQSPDAHPRQPQLTHWICWLSLICAFGMRQIQVVLKFVSLVWSRIVKVQNINKLRCTLGTGQMHNGKRI